MLVVHKTIVETVLPVAVHGYQIQKQNYHHKVKHREVFLNFAYVPIIAIPDRQEIHREEDCHQI